MQSLKDQVILTEKETNKKIDQKKESKWIRIHWPDPFASSTSLKIQNNIFFSGLTVRRCFLRFKSEEALGVFPLPF
jgi:hypothetical protein